MRVRSSAFRQQRTPAARTHRLKAELRTFLLCARRCFSPVRTGFVCAFSILSASAGKTYSASITGSRSPLIGEPTRISPVRFSIEEGLRSGTRRNHPKTDIVVTVRRMIVVTIHGPRVHLIVEPRPAPQVRRRKPHNFGNCSGILATRSGLSKFEKYFPLYIFR